MPRQRFTAEPIIAKLREAERVAINICSIASDVAWRLLPAARFGDHTGDPICGPMRGHPNG